MSSVTLTDARATRMKAEERRELILAAAAGVFGERGYVGATTDAVAKAAGVSQPYVVRMFGTKAALFQAVLERSLDRLITQFREEIQEYDGSKGDLQMCIGKRYVELLADRGLLLSLMQAFLLGADPVSVSCQTWNPSWSWYDGDADATAVFEMSTGARYVYQGSWCSPGAETSWNGVWRVSAEQGTAHWDGDHDPVGPPVDDPASPYDGVAGALRVFVDALTGGGTPMGEVHENLPSLAMVAAAVESSRSGRPVRIADLLDSAREQALRDESHPAVRAALGTT